MINKPLSNYASVPASNNLKSRLRAKFSYVCCIFSQEASTSGYCSWELKRNSKVAYSVLSKASNMIFYIYTLKINADKLAGAERDKKKEK